MRTFEIGSCGSALPGANVSKSCAEAHSHKCTCNVRQNRIKLILGAALVAALFASCSHLGRNEQKSLSPRAEEIRAAMERTVIPQVDLENVKAEDALKFWSEKSRTYDPRHFKFQHLLSYPMVVSQGTVTMSAPSDREPKVTVRRKNITSKRLLDEICGEANLVWMIAGRVVLVRPRGAPVVGQP